MIRVWDPGALLGAAAAELPITTAPADEPHGAVVVCADGGAARTALAAGAAGIVLAAPGRTDPEVLAELAAASRERPVVVLRGRLRERSRAEAAVAVAECASPHGELDAVLPDAIGWLRVLTGHHLELRAATVTEAGILALMDAGDTPASLLARSLSGVPDGGVIRVTALGAERVEVVVDEPAGVLRIGIEREGASEEEARRLESPERAALRRICAALGTGDRPRDADDLLHDTRLARAILGTPG